MGYADADGRAAARHCRSVSRRSILLPGAGSQSVRGNHQRKCGFIGRDYPALEALRTVSAVQLGSGVWNQQQLCSVGQFDLQRRRSFASRSVSRAAFNFFSPMCSRKAWTILRLVRWLFVSDRRLNHRGIEPRATRTTCSLDRSLSVFSIPQIAQFSFLYQLPFGKHLTGLAGRPGERMASEWHLSNRRRASAFSFSCAADAASICRLMATNIPICSAPLQVAGTGNLNQYFANPQVAVKPAPYTDGDAPRVLSNARIPGTDNLTASLFKEIPLEFREGRAPADPFGGFQRLESRSVRPLPTPTWATPHSAQISSQANQPRQVQIGLKLYY